MAGAGDVDGDGIPDVLIGAMGDGEEGTPPGEAFLFFGGGLATPGARLLADADVRITGGVEDFVGWSVAGAGDVDGDGLGDVLVRSTSGVGLAFGADLQFGGTVDLGADGVVVTGLVTSGSVAGIAMTTVGDLDGDGLDDILVGDSAYAGPTGVYSGRAMVFLADSLGDHVEATDAHFLVTGSQWFADFGWSGAGLGDVDGDGVPDFAVGAPGWPGDGMTYFFSGAVAAEGGVIDTTEATAAMVGASGMDRSGTSLAGPGDVDGDGAPDLLIATEAGSVTAAVVLSPW